MISTFPIVLHRFLARIRSSRSLCDVQEPLVVPCIVSFTLAIVWSGKAPKPRWKPGQLAFVSVHSPCAMDWKEFTLSFAAFHASEHNETRTRRVFHVQWCLVVRSQVLHYGHLHPSVLREHCGAAGGVVLTSPCIYIQFHPYYRVHGSSKTGANRVGRLWLLYLSNNFNKPV